MKIALIVSAFFVFILAVEAVNIKKSFCGNRDFVGNPGSKYPHLHCGKDFLTVSTTSSRHINLQGRCSNVKKVLGDSGYYYAKAEKTHEITAVLQKYEAADCPTRR